MEAVERHAPDPDDVLVLGYVRLRYVRARTICTCCQAYVNVPMAYTCTLHIC